MGFHIYLFKNESTVKQGAIKCKALSATHCMILFIEVSGVGEFLETKVG